MTLGPRMLPGLLLCVGVMLSAVSADHPPSAQLRPAERARISARAISQSGPGEIRVIARSRSITPGEIVVLTILLPSRADHVQVRAFGQTIPGFATGVRGWRAIIGIDLDVAPGSYVAAIDAGTGLNSTYTLTVKPRQFPTRRLSVDPAFVNPPAAELGRIERETERLNAVWHSPATEREWSGPFVRPVPQPANSRFGTRSVFNGEPRGAHGGADFLSPRDTPVHAPNAGRVAIAESLYFSGNTVIIDHGLGLFSLLAHLSTMTVREGDRVAANQTIGRVGATGRVTGPHLHWAVRANGARVDPTALLALLGRRRQPE